MIILDTDAITFLERRKSSESRQLRERLSAASAEHEIVTTIVTYEEQTRGWFAVFARANDAEKLIAAYDSLLAHLDNYKDIDVIPYTLDAHRLFEGLRRQKIRIGSRDLRIGAIALSRGATLWTRNIQDFGKVPHLLVKDWMQA